MCCSILNKRRVSEMEEPLGDIGHDGGVVAELKNCPLNARCNYSSRVPEDVGL